MNGLEMTKRGQGEMADIPDTLQSPDIGANAVAGIAENELSAPARLALNALVAENQRLQSELARVKALLSETELLADHDTLLPILNRRAFLREFNRVVAYAKRYQEAAGLVYFDIDNFKSINDTHGHGVGDEVLKHLSKHIVENVRETDIVGRLGGDEFGVILVRSDEQQAEAKARSLAAVIADRPLIIEGVTISLSISVGAISFSGEEEPAAALERADHAMYRDKRS